MSDITESLGVFAKDDPEYRDMSKMRFQPMSIAIGFMLLYLCFLIIKYPLW